MSAERVINKKTLEETIIEILTKKSPMPLEDIVAEILPNWTKRVITKRLRKMYLEGTITKAATLKNINVITYSIRKKE